MAGWWRFVMFAGVLAACWKPFAPARPGPHDVVPQIQMARLDNGLRVVTIVDPGATEVQVTVRYDVGAVDEPVPGLAHLVEHLMFQQVVDGESLFATLEREATEFNAFTELESTTFTARTVPANLARFVGIEAARMRTRCEGLDDGAFAREREVVRNELRQKADVLAAFAAIRDGVFADGHPYRNRTGTADTVGAITRAQACAFADAHYVPDRAVLVVSGNADAATVEQAARAAFGAIPSRQGPARSALAASRLRAGGELPVPLDSPVLVAAWALPADVAERTRLRALVEILADHVDGEITGKTVLLELGGERAPAIALAVVPAHDEPIAEVRAKLMKQIDELPTSIDNQKRYDDSFDHGQQVSLVRLYARLEDAGGRDADVAAHALAGRDPAAAVAAEIESLKKLDREGARSLARARLGRGAASIVVLMPNARRSGREIELAQIHDLGVRRRPEDPAAARRAAEPLPVPHLAITTRKLASGITVVLMPLAGSATVDVRVVFAGGTGDERSGQRGAALLAAYGLEPEPIDIADFLHFYESGGTLVRRVGLDHTTFAARGRARDLDFVMTATERLLRNGHYRNAADVVARMRVGRQRDPDVAIDAAWRTSMYGPEHPYAAAGSLDLGALDAHAATELRTARYRADTTTVIVAGGFDAAVANAWIDHVFATWSTSDQAPARRRDEAGVMPVALAVHEDTTMVRVDIALPIAGSHVQRLLATELVARELDDVRHQLGASYDLAASLEESRLATHVQISGHVDAARAADALALVRDRLAALRSPSGETAARFVAARRTLRARLRSVTASSSGLADLAERDVAATRAVGDELAGAELVAKLTLADLEKVLSGLDLGAAAIALRGPPEAIARAYAVLGRKPSIIERVR